ncbi:hypothetical protein HFO21_03525 [Rhizobium laguerreae]|uniref:hypothetical protein n=1 Tax=Rhizobium TaxID=379 RepID=UPI001030F9B3|nr:MULTISPECIES: hypothetical protein [Rhizobium]MBY3213482.1 hypothetical protein [Rhizobium laguerreae]TAU67042.1 hypothetical protein ELI45_03715 [Rhizobium ruizarguesonis]
MDDEERQIEAIAADWGVDPNLVYEAQGVLESVENNDGVTVGFFVRFGEDTDRELLDQLGVGPGEFSRDVSLNAFDEPDDDFEIAEPKERPKGNRPAYYIDEERFTSSQFRRLSRARKVEAMVQWFHENYEDPAVRMPYESAEGGYQWIWGGPYDAHEQISDNFSSVADDRAIEEAVESVTGDGLYEWAPKARREDYASDIDYNEPGEDEDYNQPGLQEDYNKPNLTRRDPTPPGEAVPTAVDATNFAGSNFSNFRFAEALDRGPRSASDSDTPVETLRLEMHSRLDDLEALIRQSVSVAPNRGHNHPPELLEIERPVTQEVLQEVVASIEEIRRESESPTPNTEIVQTQVSKFRRIANTLRTATVFLTVAAVTGIIGQEAGAAYTAHKQLIIDALVVAADAISSWVHALPAIF